MAERYKRSLFCNTKEVYNASLRSLPYTEESQSDGLRKSLRHYASEYANILTTLQRIGGVGEGLWASVLLILFVISLPIDYKGNQLIATVVAVVAVSIGILISIYLTRIIHSTPIALISIFLLALITFGSLILFRDPHFHKPLSAILHESDGQILSLVTYGALFCAGALLAAGIVLTMYYVMLAFTVFRKMNRRPDVMMTSVLFGLLRDLEDCGTFIGNVPYKADICERLEVASVLLEHNIPNAINVFGLESRRKFSERCHSGAAELRDMQARFALLDESAIDDLKRDIVRYIRIVIQGKYGLLPTGVPIIHSVPRKLVFARIIRSTFIALIPACCLVAARYAGLRLSGQLADWAIVAALVWAATTLISFDPMYKTRLNDIRTIIAMIRGKNS
jgi:hypothetical protein